MGFKSLHVALGARVLIVGLLLLVSASLYTNSQPAPEDDLVCVDCDACTAIIVGKDASVDGSVMTTHTCDGWYDSRLTVVPGGTHEDGEMVDVWLNMLHADNPDRQPTVLGKIPQVSQTYTYFQIAYPFMNEFQVQIGESTFGGRRELITPEGMFYIEQLEAIGLQRGTTAREVIQVMGQLAETYGYADGGEALTVIDPNEAWVFEITGSGPLWTKDSGKPGAVWVAERVPDDQVFVSANRSRIGQIDLNNPDYFMASPNVLTLGQEMGWYDPNAGNPFAFYEVYAPKDSFYNSRREWRVFSLVAPSQSFDAWSRRYPFSIKPDTKLSVPDLMAIKRDHYEGTEFDLTQGMAAGPFGDPNRFATSNMSNGANWERAISLFRCSYSFVSQSRNWLPNPIGGVLWFGEDAPHTTVYMPIYAGVTDVPESLKVMNRYDFSRNSAWWAFDFVENWANIAWSYMIADINAKQQELESGFFQAQDAIEKSAVELYNQDPQLAIQFLTNYTAGSVERVVNEWWAFADELVAKYNDGYVWNKSKGYPTDWLEQVHFGDTTDPALYK